MLPDRSATSAEFSAARVDPAREHRSHGGHLMLGQFEELFNCAPDAIICLDRDYNFIFANVPAQHLTGTQNLVGKNMWTLFPGNLKDPFYTNYRSTMEQRVETEFEAYYAEPLNTWFKVKVRPLEMGMAIFFHEINARKRAEAMQEQSAKRLQQVFDVTGDAILTIDREWRMTFFNRRAKELLAVKGELIGKVLWEEFPAAADPDGPYLKPYYRTMNERVATEFEAYYPAPLDRYYVIESLPSDDGMVMFFRDVTERRLWEQATEAQQKLLASVQQGALVATWTLDTATGQMEFGVGSYPVFGRPFEAISTLPKLLEIVSPAHRDGVLAATRDAVQKRTMFTVDFEVVADDGAKTCVEARGQVLGEESETLRIGGIAIDISARKNSERALLVQQQETERQKAELETIYQTADIGLALISSEDLRFLRINDKQAEIVGLPMDQIVGRTMNEIAPDVVGLVEIFRGVAAGTPVRDMIIEGELPARPGEPRTWSASYTPVRGEDGSVVAITAASLDITQRRRTEAALLHSEKLAAVGRLASSISHEINNPLEAVTNLLYIVSTDDGLPEELRGYIQTAQEELSRVSQIATQTLRFHRQATKPTWVTASGLVDAVFDLYQGRLFNSGITIDARYQTDERILCFENDIRQVLNNLIANAIDAMEGGGRIVVRAHAAHDAMGRRMARITIADTGHGMSQATAARIFDPFFTTKDLNGTGLGLWISAEIVERHHGKLKVRSSKCARHRGTAFTMVLPFDEAPEEAANPSAYSSFTGA